MGMMRDYHIREIEEGDELPIKAFYKSFISKSLPVILRGQANNWKFTKDLKNATDVDNYLSELFLTDFSDRIGWI